MSHYSIVFWKTDHHGRKISQPCSTRSAINAKEAMFLFLGRAALNIHIVFDGQADTATVYNNPGSSKTGWTAKKGKRNDIYC